jgi:integrase
MYALKQSDVDLDTNLISITKQFTSKDGVHEPKANRNRVVPIAEDLRPLLEELMSSTGYSEELWKWKSSQKLEKDYFDCKELLLPRNNLWKYGEQASVLSEFCKHLKITQVKFHDLRATFITNMLSRGVPITVVMSIVGHSRMSTTDEYNRLAGIGVKGATNSLGYSLSSSGSDFSSSLSSIRNNRTEAEKTIYKGLDIAGAIDKVALQKNKNN